MKCNYVEDISEFPFEGDEKWNARFMKIANEFAVWSEDKTTKVGCIIVNNDKRIVSYGYNQFPEGVHNYSHRKKRPEKYIWTEHAERNAINQAAKFGISINQCILYTTMYPCIECAKSIVDSGIRRVVTYPFNKRAVRWYENQKKASQILLEGDVIIAIVKE